MTPQVKKSLKTLRQILENYGFDLSKPTCLSTERAAGMVGRHHGVVTKLRTKNENSHSNLKFAYFHCIIHQQNLCSKI